MSTKLNKKTFAVRIFSVNNHFNYFFHTIIIDFILILSITSNDNDYVIFVICKGFKRSMNLLDRFTYTTTNWVNVFIIALMIRDWDISRSIISDKDKKFMSNFWKAIFIKLSVSFLVFIVYHSQTNEQFERINQTIEIALRFWLSNSKNQNKNWKKALFYIIVALNNSTNVSTEIASNEICYEFRVNDSLVMLKNLSS